MSNLSPIVRILLRYGVGFMLGAELGEQLAMDKDVVTALTLGLAALVEMAYVYAKRNGGST